MSDAEIRGRTIPRIRQRTSSGGPVFSEPRVRYIALNFLTAQRGAYTRLWATMKVYFGPGMWKIPSGEIHE